MKVKILLWLVSLSAFFIVGAVVLATINPFTKLSLSDLAAIADKADCKSDPRFHIAYARRLRQAGKLEEASAEVDKADELFRGKNAQFRLSDYLSDPNIKYAIEEGRGMIADKREDYATALKHFEAAQKYDGCASAMVNKARALDHLGRENEASALYDQAVNKACHDVQEYPLEERARFHLDHERYKEAKVDLDRTLACNACDEAYRLRALTFEGMGDDKNALADYNSAINIAPSEPALHNRALLKLRAKDYSGAMADIEAASKFEPLCPQLERTKEEIKAAVAAGRAQ